MSFKFKFLPEHKYWALQQVWETRRDQSFYSKISEWEHEQVKHWLPESPRSILDIGCGLGRAAVYLHNAHYKNPSIFYWLADADGETPTNTGVFGANEYYNSLEATQSFAMLNGLKNFGVVDTLKGQLSRIPNNSVDLITSRYSLGVHVPIEQYINDMHRIASPECVLIFGIRENRYGEHTFRDMFTRVERHNVGETRPYPQQHWLVLGGKK